MPVLPLLLSSVRGSLLVTSVDGYTLHLLVMWPDLLVRRSCVAADAAADTTRAVGLQKRLELLELPTLPADRRDIWSHFIASEELLRAVFAADRECSGCGERGKLRFEDSAGLELVPSIVCVACDKVLHRFTACIPSDGTDVPCPADRSTVCVVYSALTTGVGYSGFVKLCEAASLKVMSARSFYKLCTYLQTSMKAFFAEMQPLVKPAVAKLYSDVGDDGVLDIDVSYDGIHG